jgi:hypothetical protein
MRCIRALQISARSSSSIHPSRWNIWNPRIARSSVGMPPSIAHAIKELLRRPKRALAKRLSKVIHVWACACGSSPSRRRSTCTIYSSTVSLHPSLHALQAGLSLHYSRACFQKPRVNGRPAENVISPSLFPFKTMHRHHPIRQITMCLALQDPRVLNSQLAVASLHSASISSNPRSNIVTALKHQQQAIKLVRDWLATTAGSHVDAGAALCITQLASLEVSWNRGRYVLTTT